MGWKHTRTGEEKKLSNQCVAYIQRDNYFKVNSIQNAAEMVQNSTDVGDDDDVER